MVLNLGCACILNLKLVYRAWSYEAAPCEDFFRCSASLKFSSKKQKCPSESHHGIVWAVCLSAYAMLECFYGQPQPSLVLLEIGWTTFPFCWCPHLFLLLKTTFHLSPFLTLGQVWLKKTQRTDNSSLEAFQPQNRELSVLCTGISCGQDKRQPSLQEHHERIEVIEVATVCLSASCLSDLSLSVISISR